MTLRRALLSPARVGVRHLVRAGTRSWPEHSRLFAVGERTGWSVDEDARQLEATARRIGYDVAPARWAPFLERQAVFLTSHFEALQPRWVQSTHRLATAYLHGRPGTPGYPEFDAAFEMLRSHTDRFHAIQVTHAEMHELVLSAGVDQSRVHHVPIGIDLEHFPLGDAAARAGARTALEIPADAFVVGSFQKDGVGWAEGLEPKLIKGPDVLVAALELLKAEVRELFVLLTGPARGYVRQELERLVIPYRHVSAETRAEVARAYHALDVYVVTSRQEGGPKAVLESMASGVPLVTTRVGQAPDVVDDSGVVVDVDDAEQVAYAVVQVRDDESLRAGFRHSARARAEQYAYANLDPAWSALLDGFTGSKHGN